MSMLKKIFSDSAVYLVGKLFAAVAGLVVVPYFVREFGNESYAIFSQTLYLGISISSLVGAWVVQAYLRYSTSLMAHEIGLLLNSLVGFCALVFVGVVYFFFPAKDVYWIGILLAGSFVIYNGGKARFQVARQAKLYLISELGRALLIIICPFIVGAIFSVSHVVAMSTGFVLGNLFFISPFFQSGSLVNKSVFKAAKNAIIEWLNFGMPVAIWLGLSSLLIVIDREILLMKLNAGDVGAYSALYDVLSRATAFVFLPLASAAYPIFVSHESNGADVVRYVTSGKYIFTFYGIALLLSFGVVCASLIGIPIVKGWLSALPNLRDVWFLAAGSSFWQANLMIHKSLELQRRTKTMVGLLCCAVIFHVILELILVQHFGISASPVAVFCSSLFYGALCQLTAVRSKYKSVR